MHCQGKSKHSVLPTRPNYKETYSVHTRRANLSRRMQGDELLAGKGRGKKQTNEANRKAHTRENGAGNWPQTDGKSPVASAFLTRLVTQNATSRHYLPSYALRGRANFLEHLWTCLWVEGITKRTRLAGGDRAIGLLGIMQLSPLPRWPEARRPCRQ